MYVLVFYKGGCVFFLFFLALWRKRGKRGNRRVLVFLFFLMDGGDNVTLMSELLQWYSSSGRRGNTWLTRSGLAEHVSYVTREIR